MTYRVLLTSIGLSMLCATQTAMAAYQENYRPPRVRDEQTTSEHSPSSDAPAATPEDMQTDSVQLDATSEMTRAQFTALVVEKLYTQADLDRCFWDIASTVPPTFTLVFTDVSTDDLYAKHICVAMRDGLVRGYMDGSFRPEKKINFAETAKILSRAYVLAPFSEYDRLAPWYRAHVEALAARNAIPMSIKTMDQLMTPADAAEMIVRLSEGITWLPARRYDELLPKASKPAITIKPKPGATSSTAAPSRVSSASSASAQASAQSSSAKGGFWNPF